MRNPEKGNAFRAEGPKPQKNRLAPRVRSAYTVEFGVSMLGTTVMIWGFGFRVLGLGLGKYARNST